MKQLLIFIMLICLHVFASDTLVMNIVSPVGTFPNFIGQHLFNTVSDSLGIDMIFVSYPYKRAAFSMKEGSIDGDIARTDIFGESYPELIRIPVAYTQTSYNVYTIDSSLVITGWDDLHNSGFTIDYVRGAILAEKRLNTIKGVSLSPENTIKQCFLRLCSKRTNVVLCSELTGRGWLLLHPKKRKQIFNAGVVEAFDVNVYLAPHQKRYEKAFTDILTRMKENGTIDSLWNSLEQEWVDMHEDIKPTSPK